MEDADAVIDPYEQIPAEMIMKWRRIQSRCYLRLYARFRSSIGRVGRKVVGAGVLVEGQVAESCRFLQDSAVGQRKAGTVAALIEAFHNGEIAGACFLC